MLRYALDALDETAINIANTMCNERSSNKEKCEGCRVLLEHQVPILGLRRGTSLEKAFMAMTSERDWGKAE